MTDGQDLVAAIARPLAQERGLDLIEVLLRGHGGRQLLRVVVDRKGGVDLATCQELSGALSALLDAEDPIDGRYVLEVTSPGTDRPLADRESFDRVEGRPVRILLAGADDRHEELRGTVAGAEPDAVVLDVEGTAVRVPYGDIVKATQVLPW